jgi:hypothetical protein
MASDCPNRGRCRPRPRPSLPTSAPRPTVASRHRASGVALPRSATLTGWLDCRCRPKSKRCTPWFAASAARSARPRRRKPRRRTIDCWRWSLHKNRIPEKANGWWSLRPGTAQSEQLGGRPSRACRENRRAAPRRRHSAGRRGFAMTGLTPRLLSKSFSASIEVPRGERPRAQSTRGRRRTANRPRDSRPPVWSHACGADR